MQPHEIVQSIVLIAMAAMFYGGPAALCLFSWHRNNGLDRGFATGISLLMIFLHLFFWGSVSQTPFDFMWDDWVMTAILLTVLPAHTGIVWRYAKRMMEEANGS